MSLRSDKQKRFRWMKQDTLDQSLGFGERQLRATFGNLGYEDGTILSVWHDRGKIVTAAVPSHLGHLLEVLQDYTYAVFILDVLWF